MFPLACFELFVLMAAVILCGFLALSFNLAVKMPRIPGRQVWFSNFLFGSWLKIPVERWNAGGVPLRKIISSMC